MAWGRMKMIKKTITQKIDGCDVKTKIDSIDNNYCRRIAKGMYTILPWVIFIVLVLLGYKIGGWIGVGVVVIVSVLYLIGYIREDVGGLDD